MILHEFMSILVVATRNSTPLICEVLIAPSFVKGEAFLPKRAMG